MFTTGNNKMACPKAGRPDWANFRLLGACSPWPFFENNKSSPNFWATFYNSKSRHLIFAQNGLGYILGDFLQTHLVTLPAGFFKSADGARKLERSFRFIKLVS
jgi:hypothetical protein